MLGAAAIVAWLIYSKLKATATDTGTAVSNSFINPIKSLFG